MRARMVHVATPRSAFEAKVLAARLGAEGILWEVRGGVDGMYPVGGIEVLVAETDIDRARELLLADDVESAFADEEHDPVALPHRDWPIVAAVVAVLALFLVLRILAATG